jgi:hypothetical protein
VCVCVYIFNSQYLSDSDLYSLSHSLADSYPCLFLGSEADLYSNPHSLADSKTCLLCNLILSVVF